MEWTNIFLTFGIGTFINVTLSIIFKDDVLNFMYRQTGNLIGVAIISAILFT